MEERHEKNWQHDHRFWVHEPRGERRAQIVLALTLVTMIVEVIAGSMFGSMALLADGWHMGTHVAAFLIAVWAYRYARIHQNDPAFAFGTGKVNVLGGFASAVALAVVALVMIVESLHRFLEPRVIRFDESIVVACVGLAVNVVSALLLMERHHARHQVSRVHDHNLRAAYFHVLADAVTSVLAIIALFSGKLMGWNWLDPIMGIVGALIIIRWSFKLLTETVPILLDASIEKGDQAEIKRSLEDASNDRVVDLHVWRVSPVDYVAIISIVTSDPKNVEYYRNKVARFSELSHVTIEVNRDGGPVRVLGEGSAEGEGKGA